MRTIFLALNNLKIRLEAENKYKNNLVNNTYIYDKIPVPEKIQQLTVLHIPDWNVNCCGGKHVAKTGDIGGIKVQRVNHRKEPKNELEFVFELVSGISFIDSFFLFGFSHPNNINKQ